MTSIRSLAILTAWRPYAYEMIQADGPWPTRPGPAWRRPGHAARGRPGDRCRAGAGAGSATTPSCRAPTISCPSSPCPAARRAREMLLAELCDRTMEQAAGFIADGQRNGSLRADFGPADLLLLLTSNAAVVAATQQTDPRPGGGTSASFSTGPARERRAAGAEYCFIPAIARPAEGEALGRGRPGDASGDVDGVATELLVEDVVTS